MLTWQVKRFKQLNSFCCMIRVTWRINLWRKFLLLLWKEGKCKLKRSKSWMKNQVHQLKTEIDPNQSLKWKKCTKTTAPVVSTPCPIPKLLFLSNENTNPFSLNNWTAIFPKKSTTPSWSKQSNPISSSSKLFRNYNIMPNSNIWGSRKNSIKSMKV